MIKTAIQRRKARTIMALLNQYSWSCEYAQVRPFTTRHLTLLALQTLLKLGKTITMDCSEAIYLILRLAGFKLPTTVTIDGEGNTTTLLELPHFTDWAKVHVCTVIIFPQGPGPAHGVMVYEPDGDDPWVYSHGFHSRSSIVRLSVERAYHPGQEPVLCAVSDL